LPSLSWTSTLDTLLLHVRDGDPSLTWAEVARRLSQATDLHITNDMARNRYGRLFESRVLTSAAEVPGDTETALRDTRLELERLKATRKDFGKAIREAIQEGMVGFDVPAVLAPDTWSPPAEPEHAVLLLADWQLGKKTPSYSTEVTRQRVEHLFDQVILYLQRHPVAVETIHVLMLGDLVEGDGAIFKGQAHEIDSSLFVQVFTVANLLVNGLRRLLSVVPTVHAEGIAGNHGVVNRESHPESNADCFAMETARLILEGEPRLTFPQPLFPGHSHWSSIHPVLDKDWFMFHGDQIRSQPGTAATKAKLLGYYATMGGFDFAASGHYHSSLIQDHGAFMSFHAGSTESGNEYAREKLATGAQAGSQILAFQNRSGLTAQHIIRLP
jgi:predicted phosphodiesterase